MPLVPPAIVVLDAWTGDPFTDRLGPEVLRRRFEHCIPGVAVERLPVAASPDARETADEGSLIASLLERHPRGIEAVILHDRGVRWGTDLLGAPPDERLPDPCVLAGDAFSPASLHDIWRDLVGRAPSCEVPTLCCQACPELLQAGLLVGNSPFRQFIRRHFSSILLLAGAAWPDLRDAGRALGRELNIEVRVLDRPLSAAQAAAVGWGADAFVATSLSCCLTALAFQKPHLALGTTHEIRAYLEEIEQLQAGPPASQAGAADMRFLSPERIPDLATCHARLARAAARAFDAFADRVVTSWGRRQPAPCAVADTVARPGDDPLLDDSSRVRQAIELSQLAFREQARCLRRLTAEARQLRTDLHTLEQTYQAFMGHFRIRLIERINRHIRTIPLLAPLLLILARLVVGCLHHVRGARNVVLHWGRHGRNVAMACCRHGRNVFLHHCRVGRKYLANGLSHLRQSPRVSQTKVRPPTIFPLVPRPRAADSWRGLLMRLLWLRLGGVWQPEHGARSLNDWYRQRRPGPGLLRRFQSHCWPTGAPRFTVLIAARQETPGWFRDSVRSVTAQTYPYWELYCTSKDGLSGEIRVAMEEWAGDLRVRAAADEVAALHGARGNYVLWLRQGDAMEPHTLHRFAAAILERDADVLYGDEVTTTARNLDDIEAVRLLPAFSYDYFLCHAYLGRLLAIRTSVFRQAKGSGAASGTGPGVDTLLRVLERAETVSHIPDILYRRRAGGDSAEAGDVQQLADCRAVAQHLTRLGACAEVLPAQHWACRNVVFRADDSCRVAILIPTKDRVDLLRGCVDSIEATVPAASADVYVVNHESTDPETMSYLEGLRRRHRVLDYRGPFNFSALMNHAAEAASRRGSYSHYLLLNNDVEALSPGWLEHMLGHASRHEVGIVGALLLYPDLTVQHAGVLIGLHYGADNRGKFLPAFHPDGRRAAQASMTLLATRDQAAVTGACMLIRADVFTRLGGLDEGFAVGFGDVDLCLRAREMGYKVLIDAQAVLLHRESASRGKSQADPHPEDTRRFRERHSQCILSWDSCSSPLLARHSASALEPNLRADERIQARHTKVILPRQGQPAREILPPPKAA